MDLEAFQSLWQKARPWALPCWLCLFGLLCLSGLNPYFRPDYHDNITYFVAAESLLAGDGYSFQGAPIADWPPVTSVVLAGVFATFGTSIYAAKLVSIVAAILSVLLADRLLRREQRPDRLKTIALFTLTPVGLLTATTVASDWICAAFSFGCLLALWHLRRTRRLRFAIATGLLLGTAALTRQTGVVLGVAIVAQAIAVWRERRLRAAVPELLAALIGAAMYLAWGAYTAARVAGHAPLTGNYARWGLRLFTDFSPTELAVAVFDLFWKLDDILERIGVPAPLALALLVVPSAILIVGIGSILRRREATPADLYTLAFLALIFGYHWKMSRYLLPIAPFLIAWFFAGLRCLAPLLAKRQSAPHHPRRDRLVPAIATLWAFVLIPLDGYVLFNRSGNGAHRGISTFSNPLPADYYQAQWADLYAVCEAIRRDGQPGSVSACGFYLRYVHAFTGRTATDPRDPLAAPGTYAVVVDDDVTADPHPPIDRSDTLIFASGKAAAYRRSVRTPRIEIPRQ